MSNALAIAGVTAVLRDLLNNGIIDHDVTASVGDVKVTALPPDRITTGVTPSGSEESQLNLFLYQVSPNAAWRNVGFPSRDARGDRVSNPPLALDLHYLLTAYGAKDFHAEILLGYAMQLFHENPVLTRNAIRTALASPTPVSGGGGLPPTLQALSTSGLANQIEQIKLVPQAQSTEELSKLWTALQAKYRPSAAYLASVVLIESDAHARSPLPVLTIGANDSGVIAQPNLDPPFPTITEIVPPNQQVAVRLGETFSVNGFHLDGDVGDAVKLILTHPRFTSPLEQNPTTVSAKQITFAVPNDVDNWPSGVYTLMVGYRQGARLHRTTNQMPFALAPSNPSVTPNPAARDTNGNATLAVALSPKVWNGQRVSLLLGSHEFFAEPFSASRTSTLNVVARALDPDNYLVRVRVDGVESLLVLRSGALPVFDPAQAKVTVT